MHREKRKINPQERPGKAHTKKLSSEMKANLGHLSTKDHGQAADEGSDHRGVVRIAVFCQQVQEKLGHLKMRGNL